MDHNKVVREKMTERYLLKELEPEARNEFEEHFFDCAECALDVRAGSAFVTNSKVVLAERSAAVSVHSVERNVNPRNQGWLAWLRPAFAVPVFALLLIAIGYQNLVTLPTLTHALSQPQVLPATTVNLLTYGTNAPPLVIHVGEGFLLNVILPPDHRYAGYKIDLHNPSGGVESVPIPASGEDTWPIRFPGTNRQSGTYRLVVYGRSGGSPDVEIGSSSFQLQVQK